MQSNEAILPKSKRPTSKITSNDCPRVNAHDDRWRVSVWWGRLRADLSNILATSAERWGTEGRRRYAMLLAAAMRIIAADPEGPLTQARKELLPGLRSFHLRHARGDAHAKVRKSVHVLYYRMIKDAIANLRRECFTRCRLRARFQIDHYI